jgi:DNA invertase Pin-like site-specific DNA recombinase
MYTLDVSAYTDGIARFRHAVRYAVKTSPPPAGPVPAYSYQRFSSAAQADGDSVRRQSELRDDWLRRHPEARLDTTLVDPGVSGYTGAHRRNGKHALGSFLDLVRRGRVPAGALLLVENLDRLSREHPLEVMALVGELTRAGVVVVQLEPEQTFTADMDEGTLCMLLLGSVRGHGESKRKSNMLGKVWGEKKHQAREGKVPHGKMCPAWLELVDGRYLVKADAARAVRKVFRWCAAGLGLHGILDRLAAEGVPAFGRSGRWERSYVRLLLNSPAVRGIYQPHTGHRRRTADGEPVPGYFPQLIDDTLWHAARAALTARTRRSGRPAKDPAAANPFSGLLADAVDGSKLHVCGAPGAKYLMNAAGLNRQRGTRRRRFPLRPLVEALLSRMSELQSSDLFRDPGAGRVSDLEGKVAEVDDRLAAAVARFEADPLSQTWSALVSKYDVEKRALVAELAEARQAASNPLSATWAEAVALMHRDDPVRLRAALLATVTGIRCIFTGTTRVRVAAVQVDFRGGGRRSYVVAYEAGKSNARVKRAGRWSARSFAESGAPAGLDLTRADHVRRLEAFLATATLPGG